MRASNRIFRGPEQSRSDQINMHVTGGERAGSAPRRDVSVGEKGASSGCPFERVSKGGKSKPGDELYSIRMDIINPSRICEIVQMRQDKPYPKSRSQFQKQTLNLLGTDANHMSHVTSAVAASIIFVDYHMAVRGLIN
jgi:hypothetical protein